MDYYKRALELKDDTIENRRHIHKNAEVGLDLPNTKAYVMDKLKEYGLEPVECGKGISALIGQGEPVILLRADMDALPMEEKSGLDFACTTGTEAHCCGHDLHTAMLLTAARMLKEEEKNLKGQVKFMFQPAEEIFKGANNMIEAGILENPKVDVALGFHVAPGRIPEHLIAYNSKGTSMFSVDGFKIDIKGKGAHGAFPNQSIDPINVAAHIIINSQTLIAREADPNHAIVLTIGEIKAGNAANIIPETAIIQGTMRNDNKETRLHVKKRLVEVVQKTAETFGASATIEFTSETPPLINDPAFTDEIIGYISELDIPDLILKNGIRSNASEDFSIVLDHVKGAFLNISAGFLDERGDYPTHNPKVQFNESALSLGAAAFAQVATKWLENNKK